MANERPTPEGCDGTIPHLFVKRRDEALNFYKRAFGAEEMLSVPPPDGRLRHSELRIGNSLFHLGEFPAVNGSVRREPNAPRATPVTIHRLVADVDEEVRRAREAGAVVQVPPSNTIWGDRYAAVTDPFGHTWSFATRSKEVPHGRAS